MVRLIAIIILIIVVYYWFKSRTSGPKTMRGKKGEMDQIKSEMIQCPQCGAYFPESTGVSARVDGKMVEFCGQECLDKYIDRFKAK